MQSYLVGGAVRDRYLGREVSDRDWVVVGATPEQMLKNGFRSVGRDFPVFLHPQTQEEYALARTERKVAAGYAGFVFHTAPDVTLEEDLRRRDLTINAMAQDEKGCLIDPYGGLRDLRAGVLRHVSGAFAEDPVRILRTARFAARFGFQVADETMTLMRQMVQSGEADALVPERVWQELARGLMEHQPSRMFGVLRECGALAVLLPELDALFGVPQRAEFHPEIDAGVHTLMTLDCAAQAGLTLPERYAALLHDLGKARTPPEKWPRHAGHDAAGVEPVKAVNARLKVPRACADLAVLVCTFHIRLHSVRELKTKTALGILHDTDAFRRPERFAQMLNVCAADIRGRLNHENAPYPQQAHWLALLQAAQSVDAGAVARAAPSPQAAANAIAHARLAALHPVHQAHCAAAG